MIVAIYLEDLSLVLPVNPVNQIYRLTPQSRRQQRPKQNQQSIAFASMLDALVHTQDSDDAHDFDAFV